MKRKWDNVKKTWWEFWGIYEDDDDSIQHLSRSDKLSIWYGSFIMCMVTVALCTLGIALSNIRSNHQYEKDVEDTLNMIATYFATATEDEYDEIAQSIRHDLVFSEYGEDIETLIQYIPNTAASCPTCWESYPASAYLVCTNTGEIYSLDVFEKGDDTDASYNGMRMTFGYDEISETSVHIAKHQDSRDGYAELCRERRIVSAHKMKSTFCDNCIRQILNTIDGQPVGEFVIFDADNNIFYPVDNGESVQIGNYGLETAYTDGVYRIAIQYANE